MWQATVEQKAEVIISGIDPLDPVVWSSAAVVELCYTLPIAVNSNPKSMVLY